MIHINLDIITFLTCLSLLHSMYAFWFMSISFLFTVLLKHIAIGFIWETLRLKEFKYFFYENM